MTREERLTGGYSGRMLFVLAATWGVLQVARFALPPLLPAIRADLSLSLAEAGVVLTVLQGVYALFQYPSGRFSDTWGRATLLAPSILVLAVGVLLTGVATTPLLLVAGVGLFGVGKGLFASPSRALISDLFVENRGRALGLYGAGSDLGGIVASGAAVAVLALATWRAVFLPTALVLGVLLGLFVVWNRESYGVEEADLGVVETGRRIMASNRQRQTLIAFFLFYFMVNSVLSFLPEYLQQVKGLSPEVASAGFSVLFVIGIVANPTAGAISDRFPRRLVSIVGMVVTMAALLVLLVVESLAGVVVAIVLFAVGYKSQFPVIDAILLDAAPDANMGGDIGAARALFLGGGSLGPAVVGYVAGRYGFTVAFGSLVAMLVLAALLLARQRR